MQFEYFKINIISKSLFLYDYDVSYLSNQSRGFVIFIIMFLAYLNIKFSGNLKPYIHKALIKKTIILLY